MITSSTLLARHLLVRRLGAVLAIGAALVLTACGPDAEGADSGTTDATTAPTATVGADSSETAEPASASAGLDLPAQTVGQIADCSMWDVAALQEIWGVTFTDIDEAQVTELNGPDSQLYECDQNETDSGLGLTVEFSFKHYVTPDEAIQSMNDTRDGAKFGDTVYFVNVPVEGVGDEAFFSIPAADETNPAPVLTQIYARYGSLVILGSAVNLDGLDATVAREGLVATLGSIG